MSITIIKPGMLSSFQDRGREGYQHQGIPAAGAMDERAHRLANALAGNSGDPATLEMTLTGPTLRFDAPACFALAGADLGATLNGQEIPQHRPLVARAGDTLAFGARPANGVRGYLAVHGGFALAPVMGSETTYLRSGFGGFEGRALAKGDQVGLRQALDGHGLDALQRPCGTCASTCLARSATSSATPSASCPACSGRNSPKPAATPSAARNSASARSPTAWATACRVRRCP